MEQINRDKELLKYYKYKEGNLIPAMNQLEIENMQLRRENNVWTETLEFDEEYKISRNIIKIIQGERKHYMEEIEKWKEEDMDLLKKNELIDLLEESNKNIPANNKSHNKLKGRN